MINGRKVGVRFENYKMQEKTQGCLFQCSCVPVFQCTFEKYIMIDVLKAGVRLVDYKMQKNTQKKISQLFCSVEQYHTK